MSVTSELGGAGAARPQQGGPASSRKLRVMVFRAKNYYYSVLDEDDVKVLKKLDELIDEARKPQALANVILSVAQYLCGIDDVIHEVTIKAEDNQGKYRIKIVW